MMKMMTPAVVLYSIVAICLITLLMGAYEMYLDCPMDADPREGGACSKGSRMTRSIIAYLLSGLITILLLYGFLSGKLGLPSIFKRASSNK